MNIHPFMAEAIFLREHPEHRIKKPDGRIFWYEAETDSYYWTNPSNEKMNGEYLALGLDCWYETYLKSEGEAWDE